MGLATYRRKRDFEKTPEPAGRPARRPGRALRYVVQKHDARRLHYDFRLELDGVLKSWAVPKGPSLDPTQKRLAVEVEDHPLEYGTFEGTIPQGEYGAGSVIVWDRGTWTPHEDPHAGLRKGSLKFELDGEKLHGGWALVRMKGSESKPQWLLIKERDDAVRPAREYDVTEAEPDSVNRRPRKARVWHSNRPAARSSTGRASVRQGRGRSARVDPSSVPGARRAAMPGGLRPELATLVDAAPEGGDWLHEIKYDGYRTLVHIRDGRARLFTRSGQDWTGRFEPIAEAAARLPVTQAILDGEVVVLDADGRSSFQELQNVLRLSDRRRLHLFAFDLPYLDGYDLTQATLEDRKQQLARLLPAGGRSGPLRYSDHVAGQGAAFHREACRQQLEGIVSKRADSLYAAGRRTREWVKVKCSARQELVIGGFTEPKGSRHGIGALLLGVHDNGSLRYAGRVGTGFSRELLTQLGTRLERMETRTPPFANPPHASRGVHWVKPTLVAEAGFLGWTKDGLLRHPTFLGLREDKPARQAVRETPRHAPGAGAKNGAAQVGGVAISHPDKVLFPEESLTKLELAGYLEAVAPLMVPEVAHRPVMLLRCPEGREGACFFQKHPAGSEPDSIERVKVRGSKNLETYMAVHDAQGLVTLLQLGALEIHVFGVRADRPEQPDRVVFDLDPSPRSPWAAVIETAQRIRERLEGLNLVSYLKTTGGRGLHVVAPIRRGPGWDEVKVFATGIAAGLVREDPERLTTHLAKAKRGDRIFVDALRNGRGASWVAPWSPRARAGAPISMPIPWSELTVRLTPDAYAVRRMLRERRLLSRNPWRGIESAKQTITAAMLREISARHRAG